MSKQPSQRAEARSGVKAGTSPFARRALRKERLKAAQRASTLRSGASSYVETGYAGTSTHLNVPETGFRAVAARILRRMWRKLNRRLRRLGAWLGSTVTGLGWSMIATAVFGLTCGYAWGWLEAIFVGYAAVVFYAIALFFMFGRSIYSVDLAMVSPRVMVGEQAPGSLTVTNPTRRRLFPETIEVPVGVGLAEFHLPSLAAGNSFRGEFIVPTLKRSIITVGPVRSVRADPLLLLRRELVWTTGLQLFIHPLTTSIPSTNTGLIRDLEGNPTRDLTNSDVSFHALREYTAGDDRRHIHWKSTARTGQMMVRQFEQTRRSQLLIALSTCSNDYYSEEEFELAVSVTGSVGIRAIRDGRDTNVAISVELPEYTAAATPAARQLRVSTPSRLLDELSGVSHTPRAISLNILSRVCADSITGISVAFLVFGSLPTSTQIRAASLAFSPDTEVVAVVCNPGIVPSMRRIDGLTVLMVGYLDDLKRALSKAATL
ncbi:DUF58 domain-containing protein [Klugiella xanthotipulae]|uniref:Uncharacterized protein (DUF58 family) n=1 Tax=Klugiella xanthotipulae TaxID=244735 RepID=A0A543I4W5_9MICO|nr:DUF58 domain-containing protein [Klugiella xanthotipulae]TQM65520.1 uncharacterized protein (DUF58 family) [Klugiella xanthotipulae]